MEPEAWPGPNWPDEDARVHAPRRRVYLSGPAPTPLKALEGRVFNIKINMLPTVQDDIKMMEAVRRAMLNEWRGGKAEFRGRFIT